jgi:hypothetical protein
MTAKMGTETVDKLVIYMTRTQLEAMSAWNASGDAWLHMSHDVVPRKEYDDILDEHRRFFEIEGLFEPIDLLLAYVSTSDPRLLKAAKSRDDVTCHDVGRAVVLASSTGNLGALQSLIDWKGITPKTGEIAMCTACLHGMADAAKALIDHGVEFTDNSAAICVRNGHLKMVQTLRGPYAQINEGP